MSEQDARRLRLAFVYDGAFPDSIGGVERRNLELARALVRRGHEVTIAAWMNDVPAAEPGLDYLLLSRRTGIHNSDGNRRLSAAIEFARDAAKINLSTFDVVETANIPFAHVASLQGNCIRYGKPLVVTWHEYWGTHWLHDTNLPMGTLFGTAELAVAQLGSVAIAVSAMTARRVRRARPFRSVKLVYSGAGAQLPRSQSSGAPPLLYAGRLLPHKRLDVLLRAVATMERPAHGLGKVLTIVGDGPEGERLRGLSRSLGIEDDVRFTGRVDDDEYYRLLTSAKVAVQPSSREGFGLFALEAMCAGLPVVYCTSHESAVGELVRDGREGFATRPSPATLGAALTAVLRDDALRENLSARARARAQQFSWDRAAARFAEVALAVSRSSRKAREP